MKTTKTTYIFLLLISTSWIIEFGLGIFIIHLIWGTAWFPLGGKNQTSIVAVWAQEVNLIVNTFVYEATARKHAHVLNWTASGVFSALIWFYVALHAVNAIWFGFLEPSLRLRKLGARKPSTREREAFTKAVEQIASARGEQISAPGSYRSADGLGLQTRWVGYTLIIDRKLYTHRFFLPLLAHELGHSNSEDRIAHRLYAMLPRPTTAIGTLGGFPIGLGRFLLYPAWQWYWRQRIFAADRFADQAGQGAALEQVLDKLYLNLDKPTKWGREWTPTPYVEQRIDRLQQLRYP